jgi:PAS domain S-box-containing protein
MSPQPPARILLVDDDATNRQALGWFFRNHGFATLEAATGAEALRLAQTRPDLVVLDVSLPDLSGFEVCRRIKANAATAGVLVIHLSGRFVGSGDRAQGLEGGADGYLVKPVAPRELLATVRALLRIREAEEAARAAAQQWRTTFDAISDAVCLLDAPGNILRCNRAMCELLGRPFGALIGQPVTHSVQEAMGLPDAPDLGLSGAGPGRSTREVALGRRWFHVTVDPIAEGPGSASAGSVLILTDITRHKELEDQLRQGQKLEAIGRLAGGIAHDFNNLLTAVLGNASLLLRSLPREGREHELVSTIERAAWRAAELTRQLLGFSRQTLLWLKPVSLNDSVSEVVGILERTIDPRITLEVRRAPGLWTVQADAGQMSQVLMNLCLNACDAMPDGGRLLLETTNEDVGEEYARHNLDARPGPFVLLRVADTGTGIPPELLPRIYDPFFTTKPPGKGTGLGLAMVFGIVKQHQGWVECHTELGRGTRFDIYLPRLAEPAVTTEASPGFAAAPPGMGSGTVLVADDNAMLRNLAAAFLRAHGYQVVLAEDGEQAVEVYRRERGRIRLVILDLMMPRLSGQEALRRLKEIDPDVPVLFASGYSDAQLSAEERALIAGFVSKPYREDELVRAARAAQEAARRPNGPSASASGAKA